VHGGATGTAKVAKDNGEKILSIEKWPVGVALGAVYLGIGIWP